MTVRDVLAQAKGSIAQRDAELLLGHAVGRERTWLMAHPEAEIAALQIHQFANAVARRAGNEPLQYITGCQEFFGLSLYVSPAVLIPRPETELLVEAVLEWAWSRPSVLQIVDIGTGSGAIALALAANLPEAEMLAIDVSADALEVAKRNAVQHHLADRVSFVQSDLLACVNAAGTMDVVASNPPYVPAGDRATMQRDVAEFEPHLALFAGNDGLDIYRRLVPQAAIALRTGGLLAMEIGHDQASRVADLLLGWNHVRFIPDYAGFNRIVLAERAGTDTPGSA